MAQTLDAGVRHILAPMEGIVVNSHLRTSSSATACGRGGVSALLRLCAIRGLIAILWAVGFATFLDSLAVGAIILLAVYPLIDVVALLMTFGIGPVRPGAGCHCSTSESALSLRSL
jgi:hypothetical protein